MFRNLCLQQEQLLDQLCKIHRANWNSSVELQTASPLLLLLPLPQPGSSCVFEVTEVFGLASPQVFVIRENSCVPEVVAPAVATPQPDKFPLLQTVWTLWVSVLSLLWGCDILFLNSSNVTLLYAWFFRLPILWGGSCQFENHKSKRNHEICLQQTAKAGCLLC